MKIKTPNYIMEVTPLDNGDIRTYLWINRTFDKEDPQFKKDQDYCSEYYLKMVKLITNRKYGVEL